MTELTKSHRIAYWSWLSYAHPERIGTRPALYSSRIDAALSETGTRVQTYDIAIENFKDHVARGGYPLEYAAGPIDEGGAREQKLLEYFVSFELLKIKPSDIVIDVASELSIFPEVARKLVNATVYRQDLVYPTGVNGEFIGGNASNMPLPDCFADKIVLHNAFEHFEGSADTDFILEAWRVLKPGGVLCILPLFMSETYSILTDPLVNRAGLNFDDGAQVINVPWWHNRFGRMYDVAALQRRVLEPGKSFATTIYQVLNLETVHRRTDLHYILFMKKPVDNEQQVARGPGATSATANLDVHTPKERTGASSPGTTTT